MFGQTEKIQVLILDDEPLIRFVIKAQLRNTQFEPTTVSTSEEAIAELKKRNFHVIVTDVVMGAVDGFMFRDLVRTINKTLPVIFFTSLVNDTGNLFMAKVMSDPYSYYIQKNAGRDYLVGRLEQVVQTYMAEQEVVRLQGQIDKELELAGVVQRAMLPRWAHFDKRFCYGYLWNPLGKISGDLFEYFPLSENDCLFVFGDIAGHGTHAALEMAAIQSFLKERAHVLDLHAREPEYIAKEIDRFLTTSLGGVSYMTGLIVYVNVKEHFIRYHNAGCVDLLAFRMSTGELIVLNPEKKGSVPMGMIPGAEYRPEDTVTATIPDDFFLLAYSDGLMDLSSNPDGSGSVNEELMLELGSVFATQCYAHHNTVSVPYHCQIALNDWGYKHSQDDITILVFRTIPEKESREIYFDETEGNAKSIDDAAARLGAAIRERYDDDELAVKAELLFQEHLMNVCSHGMTDDQRVYETVPFSVRKNGGNLEISLWDRGGVWKEQNRLVGGDPDKVFEARNENFASNGRGIPIIRKISPNISYHRWGTLNENTFYIPLKENSQPESTGNEKDRGEEKNESQC